MDILARIAEEKIKEAIRSSELDSPAYRGKPLQQDDLSHVPPELRAAFIVRVEKRAAA